MPSSVLKIRATSRKSIHTSRPYRIVNALGITVPIIITTWWPIRILILRPFPSRRGITQHPLQRLPTVPCLATNKNNRLVGWIISTSLTIDSWKSPYIHSIPRRVQLTLQPIIMASYQTVDIPKIAIKAHLLPWVIVREPPDRRLIL